MKDWVRPCLLADLEAELEEKSKLFGNDREAVTEIFMKAWKDCAEDDEFVFLAISSKVKTNFDHLTLTSDVFYFVTAFGSVLSDLPKDVFIRLIGIKNVVYTFHSSSTSAVASYGSAGEEGIQWDEVIVANFFYESVLMPIAALRGRIVKVLAFIDSGQIGPNVVIGDEAEKIAGDWGFAEEIAAMRKYDAEHELQEQQQTTHESALFAKIQQRLTNNDATESFNVGKEVTECALSPQVF